MLFTGREVRIGKNCARGLEYGPRPQAEGRTQDRGHSFSQYGPTKKLRSFNSQLHSALSVVGYHDRGQEIGKYCPLPEPIRLQDSQDTTRSRSIRLQDSQDTTGSRSKK